MTDRSTLSPIEQDLGVSPVRGSGSRSRVLVSRDVVATSQELQHQALALVDDRTVPQTLVDKLVDAVFPDPIRRARRGGEEAMAKKEVSTRVRIHDIAKEAQVRQFEAYADTFGRACELEAEEEIGRRAMEAATVVDTEIGRSGAEFDQRLEAEVKDAANLESAVARRARADRIQRRVDLRGEVEDAILHSVRDVVTGQRRRT